MSEFNLRTRKDSRLGVCGDTMYSISFETKCGSEKSSLLNVSSSVYSARRQETGKMQHMAETLLSSY
jgi:hypothetical protein